MMQRGGAEPAALRLPSLWFLAAFLHTDHPLPWFCTQVSSAIPLGPLPFGSEPWASVEMQKQAGLAQSHYDTKEYDL